MSVAEKLKENLDVIKSKGKTLICRCPVCGGTNLKINLNPTSDKYGAYKCWDNKCSSKDIRRFAGITSTSSFSYSKTFSDSNLFQSKLSLHSKKPNSFQIEEKNICKVRTNYKSPTRLHSKPLSRVCYYYSPTKRIVRLDNFKYSKKYITIQYWDSYLGWIAGIGEDTWPEYSYGCDYTSGNTLIIVEGEKTAEHIKSKTNLAAITFCGGFFEYEYIYSYILNLKSKGISNTIYIPDDDNAGYSKASKIAEACAVAEVSYIQKNIKKLNTKKIEGFDIADITESSTIYNFIIAND